MGSDDSGSSELQLSSLRERASRGDVEAVEELLIFERDHGYQPPAAWSAPAIFHARLIRASLENNAAAALALLDGVVWTYDTAAPSFAGRAEVEELVADAATLLREQGQPEEGRRRFEDLIRRHQHRQSSKVAQDTVNAARQQLEQLHTRTLQ